MRAANLYLLDRAGFDHINTQALGKTGVRRPVSNAHAHGTPSPEQPRSTPTAFYQHCNPFRLAGHSGVRSHPDPFPNLVVKRACADDSVGLHVKVGHRCGSPDLDYSRILCMDRGFAFRLDRNPAAIRSAS